jgi:hypothetical protein
MMRIGPSSTIRVPARVPVRPLSEACATITGMTKDTTPGTRPRTAGVITRYAAQVRDALGLATAPAVSYAGLWLLLAHLAPVAAGRHRAAVAEAIGLSCEDAGAAAADLLAAEHPTLAAAMGAWARPQLAAPLAVDVEPLPDQAGLDRWASENTRGLIERFPVTVGPETLLIVASALVLQPRWDRSLGIDDDGMLLLDDGLQTLVDTEAAGLVAVAKPFSDDGVDVISVIAEPGVAPDAVWRAVDEVVERFNAGALWHGEYDGEIADGHAWTIREVTESFVLDDAPPDGGLGWRSRLPAWSCTADSALSGAPGVAEVIAALADAAPALAGPYECLQTATAAYDSEGFTAAAVTAMAAVTGAPLFVERTFRRVEITFDRPHAVVAVARGGPWEGVPVFHAWVTPGT